MPNLFRTDVPMNPSPSEDNVIANTQLLKDTVGFTSKNLFAPNYIGYEMALFGDSQGAYINSSTGGLTYLASVETDTDYVVSRKSGEGNSFIIAGFTTLPPTPSTTPAADSAIIIDDNNYDTYTFNSDDYQYIAFTVNKGSGDSHTLVNTAQGMIHKADILDNSYEPYTAKGTIKSFIQNINNTIKSAVFGVFYPVGTIYETLDSSFNPNTAWGGTWTKIEGKFLLGSSSSHAINTTGGEESHYLTVNELPPHAHDYFEAYIDDAGGLGELNDGDGRPLTINYVKRTSDSAGSGWSHNNMPPYYTVNIWQRTA